MPTVKPRVAVTLEPSTHEVIARLAELQGRTRGAIIAELLDEVAPALTRTVALLEAAAAAPEQVKAGLRAVVEGVHRDLVAVSGDAIGQMDMLFSALSGGTPTPVPVTRGSGSDEPHAGSTHQTPSNPVTTRVPAGSKGAKGTKTQKPKNATGKGGKDARPEL